MYNVLINLLITSNILSHAINLDSKLYTVMWPDDHDFNYTYVTAIYNIKYNDCESNTTTKESCLKCLDIIKIPSIYLNCCTLKPKALEFCRGILYYRTATLDSRLQDSILINGNMYG
jgi:hypothetical protein